MKKFIPLSYVPDLSSSKDKVKSISVKQDNSGFPHVSWVTEVSERNTLNYKYWDGLKWSYCGELSKVNIVESDISTSLNSLVLNNDGESTSIRPSIAYSRRNASGSELIVATYIDIVDEDGWYFNNNDVVDNVVWVGLVDKNKIQVLSSSSSGVSSSSSSTDDSEYFFVSFSTDTRIFNIYGIESYDGNWNNIGQSDIIQDIDSNSIKIDISGNHIAISYKSVDSTRIYYNFFDIDQQTWTMVSFKMMSYSLSYGEIIDYSMVSRESGLYFVWSSYSTDYSYLNSISASLNGIEFPSDSSNAIVETNSIDVFSDFSVNSYKNVTIALKDGIYPCIFAAGAMSKTFLLKSIGADLIWAEEIADIECSSRGVSYGSLNSFYNDSMSIAFSSNNSGVYYLKQNPQSSAVVSNPDIVLIGEGSPYHVEFQDGLLDGTEIWSINNNYVCGISKDAKKPILIVQESSFIKFVNLSSNLVINERKIDNVGYISSIDVNFNNGYYVVSYPDIDSVVIYPQSGAMTINEPLSFDSIVGAGFLNSPSDARFDPLRNRLWIADRGRNRVLRYSIKNKFADYIFDDIVAPHSVCVNYNTGGVFIKGYLDSSLVIGSLVYINADGEELARFNYNLSDGDSSSSSSESTESEERPNVVYPAFNTMVYDYTRSRLWWCSSTHLYMADINSSQVISRNVIGDGFANDILCLDVELKTGNALVITENYHRERFVAQYFKDNSQLLAIGYIGA